MKTSDSGTPERDTYRVQGKALVNIDCYVMADSPESAIWNVTSEPWSYIFEVSEQSPIDWIDKPTATLWNADEINCHGLERDYN